MKKIWCLPLITVALLSETSEGMMLPTEDSKANGKELTAFPIEIPGEDLGKVAAVSTEGSKFISFLKRLAAVASEAFNGLLNFLFLAESTDSPASSRGSSPSSLLEEATEDEELEGQEGSESGSPVSRSLSPEDASAAAEVSAGADGMPEEARRTNFLGRSMMAAPVREKIAADSLRASTGVKMHPDVAAVYSSLTTEESRVMICQCAQAVNSLSLEKRAALDAVAETFADFKDEALVGVLPQINEAVRRAVPDGLSKSSRRPMSKRAAADPLRASTGVKIHPDVKRF